MWLPRAKPPVSLPNLSNQYGPNVSQTELLVKVDSHLSYIADDPTLRQQLLQAPVVNAIVEMTRTTKFAILKNDGIIALTVMLADHDSPSSKAMLSEGNKKKDGCGKRICTDYP